MLYQFFKDPDVAKTVSVINDKYVIVPADKAKNNIVFVCKIYYIQCVLSKVENKSRYKAYTAATLNEEERKTINLCYPLLVALR